MFPEDLCVARERWNGPQPMNAQKISPIYKNICCLLTRVELMRILLGPRMVAGERELRLSTLKALGTFYMKTLLIIRAVALPACQSKTVNGEGMGQRSSACSPAITISSESMG